MKEIFFIVVETEELFCVPWESFPRTGVFWMEFILCFFKTSTYLNVLKYVDALFDKKRGQYNT